MADLQSLNLQITSSSNTATSAIDSTIRSLRGLQNALGGFGNRGNIAALKNFGESMKEIGKAVNSISNETASKLRTVQRSLSGFGKAMEGLGKVSPDSLQNLPASIDAIANAVNRISPETLARITALADGLKALSAAGKINFGNVENGVKGATSGRSGGGFSSFVNFARKGGAAVFKGFGTAARAVGRDFQSAIAPITNFGSQLLRIAKMRMMRALIRAITQGAVTGLKNLAKASKEAKQTMNTIASIGQSLSNALGGALYSALASLLPIIQAVSSALMTAINAMSALFAALGGKLTYKAATNSTKEFDAATKEATGSAEKLKQELMGFDEINALSPDNDSSGGSGGNTDLTNYKAMFEESNVPQILKDAVKNADFSEVGKLLADKLNKSLSKIDWNKIIEKATRIGNMGATLINGFFGEVDAKEIGDAIAGILTAGLRMLNTFWYGTDWKLIGIKLKIALKVAIAQIKAEDIGLFIVRKINAGLQFLIGFTSGVDGEKISEFFIEIIQSAVDSIKDTDLQTVMDNVGSIISGLFKGISGVKAATLVTTLGSKIFKLIKSAIKMAGKILANLTNAITNVATALLKSINKELADGSLRESIQEAITDFFKNIDWRAQMELTIEIVKLFFELGVDGLNSFRNFMSGGWIAELLGDKETSEKLKVSPTEGLILSLSGKSAEVEVEEPEKMAENIKRTITAEVFKNGNLLNWWSPHVKLNLGGTTKDVKVSSDAVNALIDRVNTYSMTINEATTSLMEMNSIGLGDAGLAELVNSLQLAAIQAGYLYVNTESVSDAMSHFKQSGDFQDLMQYLTSGDWSGSFTDLAYVLQQSGISLETFSTYAGLSADQIKVLQAAITALEQNPVQVDTKDAEESIAGVETVATEAKDALNKVDGQTVDPNVSSAEFTADMSNMQSALEGTASSIKAVGEDAENTKVKIVEIPTEKEIAIKIVNATSLVKQLTAFKNMIKNMPGKTIELKVKAGLSSGAKTFLNAMANIDSSIRSVVNSAINASQFASGGFPKAGDLFWANESGAELVGSVGGKTAVANQNEIGDAIFKYMDKYGGGQSSGIDESRLANAIVSACRSAGMGAVYLDGKQLAQSINRESMRIGKSVIKY